MENVFNIKYNARLDRLELPKEKKTSKVLNFINKNKILFYLAFYIKFSTKKIVR